jgi:hypothetical protein
VMDSVASPDELIDLVKFLVARAGAH